MNPPGALQKPVKVIPQRRRKIWWLIIGAVLAPIFFQPGAAAPPPALQDSGNIDGEIDPSQKADFLGQSGNSYRFRSWFEQGSVFAVGGITVDELRPLAAEVTRLKSNACYTVVVRSLVTATVVNKAVEKCDLVYIVAHGSKKLPYLDFGGRPSAQPTSAPSPVNARSIWIGACFGQEIIMDLNAPGGSRYRTLPKETFATEGDAAGTAFRSDIIKGLTAELKMLQDKVCELKTKVCILAGVAELNTE